MAKADLYPAQKARALDWPTCQGSHIRGISKDKLTLYLRAFELRCRVCRKPEKEALNIILETAL